MWYEIEDVRQTDASVLFAVVRAPADSPWFCGHFPGEPILPGVAQLGMVFEVVSRAGGGKARVQGVSRVRFKQAVRPEDRLKIVASPKKGETEAYDFRILNGDEVVCTGVMTLERV